MTSTVLSIQEEIDQLELAIENAKKQGKKDLAKAFEKSRNNAIAIRDSSHTIEKKNESESIAKGYKGQAPKPDNSDISISNTDINILTTEQVGDKDNYKFKTKTDFIVYARLKDSLRNILRNWLVKKVKTDAHIKLMNIRVEALCDAIHYHIEENGVQEYKDILKESEYKLSSKAFQEIEYFGFYISELKEDFDF